MFPVSRRRVFVLVIFHRHGLEPVVVFDEIKRKSQASQRQVGGGAVQVRCGAVEVTLHHIRCPAVTRLQQLAEVTQLPDTLLADSLGKWVEKAEQQALA